jgi:hypothetical protein
MSAVPSRSVEAALAPELALTDALAAAELERIRRAFAYRNHPDTVVPAYKAHAPQRDHRQRAIDRALARGSAK